MEKQNLDRALWLRENINMFQSEKDEFVFRKQNKKLCGISLHFENPDNHKEIRQTTYLTNPSEPLTAAIYTAVEKEYDRYLNELKEEYDKIF